MKPTRLTLLALTLTLAAGLGHAQAIWKWKDKDGRIQISDRAPPNDVPARDILSQPAGASSKATATAPAPVADVGKAAPTAPAASGVESALDKKRKQDAADKASQQAAAQAAEKARVAAAKAENCSRARGHMAALESGQRMSRMNANGEREFLDDQARAAESARTRQLMDSNCQ